MRALLAVVYDTWHESKRQIVFILLIAMLVLLSIITVALPQTFEPQIGDEPGFGTVFSDEPNDFFSEMWWQNYMTNLAAEEDVQMGKPGSGRFMRWAESRRAELEDEIDTTPYEQSVQAWLQLCVSAFFTISMLAFIAACAGYFPRMMREGAVDAVVSKPTSRLSIFLGKYIGGLALFFVAMLACHVLIYVGIGARTGVWHARLFMALGFEMFAAAVLYAFLAFLGMLSRSSVLTTVLGYVYYMVIDTALGTVISLIDMGMIETGGTVASMATWARRLIPNFSLINGAAVTSVLTMPFIDWEVFVTGGVWTLVTLALGYLVFRRRDF